MKKTIEIEQGILEELVVYNPINQHRKIRLGKGSDGGYVLIENEINKIQAFYSYGINDDYSFDEDLYKKTNAVGRLFDPTVTYPDQIIENLYFKEIGLATGEGSITEHISMFCDIGKRMILKIDIEGAEWKWLAETTQEELNNFDQILIEYHGFEKANNYKDYKECLSKINKNFYLIHVHGNNHVPLVKINKSFTPEVLECCYIRKDLCDCKINTELLFPQKELDVPNHKWLPDIKLNYWPFITGQSQEIENIAHEEARSFNKMHDVYKLMYSEIVRLNHELANYDSEISSLRSHIRNESK